MWAITFEEPGPPEVLRWTEVAVPEARRGELLVRVRATAVNRADVLQRRGLYPPPPGVRPDIPGLEFAGVVENVGEGVSRFREGDRVMGLLPGEGYAERARTPEALALPVPENLSWEEAAAVPEVFFTAFDALSQLDARAGEKLLVHAVAGGVGSAALQLAKNAGLTVFGTAGSDRKLRFAAGLGLDLGINRRSADFEAEILRRTDGRGVDAVIDFVGADYWPANLNCLAVRGRMMLVGLLGGSHVETDLGILLRKRLRIIGTVLRSRSIEEKAELTRQFERRVLPLLRSGAVGPVVDRVLPLNEAAKAHRLMESNKNAGKIVLKVP